MSREEIYECVGTVMDSELYLEFMCERVDLREALRGLKGKHVHIKMNIRILSDEEAKVVYGFGLKQEYCAEDPKHVVL